MSRLIVILGISFLLQGCIGLYPDAIAKGVAYSIKRSAQQWDRLDEA
jgi:hypothetical protein